MNYKKKLWLGCSMLALAGHVVTSPAVVTAEIWQARQLNDVLADVVVTENNAVSYRVKYGDTLGVISEAMDIELRYLARINDITNVDMIFPETVLTAQFDDNHQAESLTVDAPDGESVAVNIPVNLSPIETIEEIEVAEMSFAMEIEEVEADEEAIVESDLTEEETSETPVAPDAPVEGGRTTDESLVEELPEEAPVEELPEVELPEEAPVEELPEVELPEEAPVEELPEVELPEEAPVEELPAEEAPEAEVPSEEPIIEEPIIEEPIIEEPIIEEPIIEEPIIEEPIIEEPIIEEPIIEEPIIEEPIIEEPIIEEPIIEEPIIEEPIIEEPIIEEPIIEEPIIEEPIIEEPIIEEPIIEEPATPDLNGLAYNAAAFRDEIVNMYGVTAYGLRAGDSGDHGTGLAVDFMVPVGSSIGDEIANYAINSMGANNISYVIWEQQIYGDWTGGWEWMEDRGSDTANHYDHVHVSFY